MTKEERMKNVKELLDTLYSFINEDLYSSKTDAPAQYSALTLVDEAFKSYKYLFAHGEQINDQLKSLPTKE